MHHRITLDLHFPEPQYAQQLKDLVMPFLSHAITINPGMPNEEHSLANTQLCGHDHTPPEECQILWHWESTP